MKKHKNTLGLIIKYTAIIIAEITGLASATEKMGQMGFFGVLIGSVALLVIVIGCDLKKYSHEK